MGQAERRIRAGSAGGLTGFVVGVTASVLHSGLCPKRSPSAGLFMAVVLGFGSAFRQW